MSELTIKSTGQMISTETIDGDIATLNLGPTHPATHGVFQNILKVDGERILSAVVGGNHGPRCPAIG